MKRVNVMLMALAVTAACWAQDVKTVVFKTSPEMHCGSCENRIKAGLQSEKGVKDITTDLTTKTVTVQYDADETNVANLQAAFKKIDYEATAFDGQAAAPAEKKGCTGCGAKKDTAAVKSCCAGKKEAAAPAAQKKSCCAGKAEAKAEKKGCACCAGKKEAATAEKKSCCSGKAKAATAEKKSCCSGKAEAKAEKKGCACGSKKAASK